MIPLIPNSEKSFMISKFDHTGKIIKEAICDSNKNLLQYRILNNDTIFEYNFTRLDTIGEIKLINSEEVVLVSEVRVYSILNYYKNKLINHSLIKESNQLDSIELCYCKYNFPDFEPTIDRKLIPKPSVKKSLEK